MTIRHTVLIVDDEEFVRDSLVDLLESEGYATVTAGNAGEALEILRSEQVSVIVTDLRMPAGDGFSLLEATHKQKLGVPVILLTGVGTVPDAVRAIKAGAFDFIQKPVEPEQFVLLIRRAANHRDLLSEVEYLRHTVQDLRGSVEMVGSSPALQTVRSLIDRVAGTDATVLVTGESGTGKELVAAEIHQLSPRAQRNFVSVNCAAIPDTLFESEFFGHRRGAFTSATSDRVGRCAEADGGTLALDEIGTLKQEMQAKLLRFLETGEYQVLGESRTRVADARVVAITNEDLAERVQAGEFRADLFYRLNVFPIRVPPLRERSEDIPELAAYFVARARVGGRDRERAPSLPPETCDVLKQYEWPGNVRELRNVMERAVILAGAQGIDAGLVETLLGTSGALPVAGEDTADLHLRRRSEALERDLIRRALARVGGKKREAAALLGIDPKNLAYYLKKHGAETGTEAREEES